MLDLRRFKEARVLYGMHSTFVRQVLNLWSVCNRIIPKPCIELVKGALEPSPQLQWSMWFREEAKIIEQWSKASSREISQDQILGKGDYITIERQSLYDDHILDLCCAETLECLDRIGEIGRKIESNTKVTQGTKEVFTNFLQRLTSAVSRMTPNSEARQIVIESLTFENANSLCKRIIRPLKPRLAPLEE